MPRALLSLGGNVGDSRATLARAVAMLCDGDDVKLIARSADYQTPPWGQTQQAAFINLCLLVETILLPRQLLERAHDVERRLGRDRASETRWGPRTADIDILEYDGMTLSEPGLTLPHPRLLERAFVLVPLAEIAPDHVISGHSVTTALAALDSSSIKRLES